MIECSEPDIIVATETCLKPEIFTAELELDDYNVYRRDRPSGVGGGVMIAVHNSISSTEVSEEINGAEFIWTKILLSGHQQLYVGACYRPNVITKTTTALLQASVEHILDNQHKNVILACDFNLPGWNWKEIELKPECLCPANHLEFKEFIDNHGHWEQTEESKPRVQSG